jgi:hypothetical protein
LVLDRAGALGSLGPLAAALAFVSVMKKSIANTGTNYSVLLELEQKVLFR